MYFLRHKNVYHDAPALHSCFRPSLCFSLLQVNNTFYLSHAYSPSLYLDNGTDMAGPLMMGPIRCSETSVRNYYSLRNSPEGHSSQQIPKYLPDINRQK